MLTLYIFADNLCSARVKWLLLNAMWAIFKIYHGDDDVLFVLDQQLDFHSGHSLKQQFLGRHVTPLRHIILIPRKPVFALTPICCMHRTNKYQYCSIFLDLMIYRTRCEHASHYTTSVIASCQTSDNCQYAMMYNQGIPQQPGILPV